MSDHYKTLRVPPRATLEEIKKAYRKLAKEYHPDKNAHHAAPILFREVQHAYSVLSDSKARKKYDAERYYSGRYAKEDSVKKDTSWVLQQSAQLQAHVSKLYSADIHQQMLHDYIMALLSEEHLAMMQLENNTTEIEAIVRHLMAATEKMEYRFLVRVYDKLKVLASDNEALQPMILERWQYITQQHRYRKWQPIGIICIAIVLCLFMYLLYKR